MGSVLFYNTLFCSINIKPVPYFFSLALNRVQKVCPSPLGLSGSGRWDSVTPRKGLSFPWSKSKTWGLSEEPEQGRSGGQSRDLAKAWSAGARTHQSLPRGDADLHQGKCMSLGATQVWMDSSGKQFFPLRIDGRVNRDHVC